MAIGSLIPDSESHPAGILRNYAKRRRAYCENLTEQMLELKRQMLELDAEHAQASRQAQAYDEAAAVLEGSKRRFRLG